MSSVSALLVLTTAIAVGVVAVAALWQWARPRSGPAASPEAAAAALRGVATVLVVRVALAVVFLLFFGIAKDAGKGGFSTVVVIAAGAAGATAGVYLLMAVLRVRAALRGAWALLAALLLTWSIVISALQGWAAYRRWSLGEAGADLGWLGEATIFGSVAFLLGMLALASSVVAAVERHRPDVRDLDADGVVYTAIIGLFFTCVIHLPLSDHLAPSTNEPGAGVAIVMGHLLFHLGFVPLLRRGAARLETGAVAPARISGGRGGARSASRPCP